ncbi:MAG: SDR family oxidoreductase [Marinobacter sp.]|uniref:SDR family NAD(P)-dependent oxidoreductase n=1 Tax=Pseudomonadota TaxID=1224 RepID=UPI003297E5C9
MNSKSFFQEGVIAVTGASRGVGAAIANKLLANGHTVACLSRSGLAPSGYEETAESTRRMLPMKCDVTDDSSISTCLSELSKKPGGLRVLINNAGIHTQGPSAKFATEDFEHLLRTNTLAVFSACRESYPYLKEAGGGVIINIGSFFARLGASHNACYSATKAAVDALTRSLAVEWARDNITVINLAPGYVETDLNYDYLVRDDVQAYLSRQIPIGRASQPSEVGEIVAMMLRIDPMLLTGQTLYADGGHSIAHGNIR